MFQTYDHAKLHLPWSETGENAWTYAELLVNHNWFFADCKITDGIDTVSSSYLLSKSKQIGDLISNPNISIQAIYVVSPPHMNDKNSWNMDKLNRVSSGLVEDEGYEFKVEIYELKNGGKYYSSSDFKSIDCIKNITVMFDLDT